MDATKKNLCMLVTPSVLARRLLLLLAIAVGLAAMPARAQCDSYVDDDAPNDPGPGNPNVSDPLEDGSSEHPFDSIQEAVDAAADTDVICVRAGTYRRVQLPCSNPSNCCSGGTCRGVHLKAEDPLEPPIIDNSTWSTQLLNGIEIDSGSFEWGGNQAVIEGFVIENNKASGISCLDAAPTIRDCVIRNNSAVQGGGVFLRRCDAALQGNRIEQNSATGAGATPGNGGGLYVEDSDIALVDNVFCRNYAAHFGGGISTERRSHVTMDMAGGQFEENTSDLGGGISAQAVGNVYLNRVLFRRNIAEYGGAIYSDTVPASAGAESGAVLIITTSNSLFTANAVHGPQTDDGRGGAIHVGSEAWMNMLNCTFSLNRAEYGGAINAGPGDAWIRNSIFWADTAEIGGNEFAMTQGGGLDIDYSVVDGGEGTIHQTGTIEFLLYGQNNIESDPLFCRPERVEFHLSVDSPAIDWGNNSDVIGSYDLGGDTRIVDGDFDGIPEVDMGAYEYQREPDPCAIHTGLARACPCPAASIESESPADGTRDARQPHPPDNSDLEYRQGIGRRFGSPYPVEPIGITFSESVEGADDPLCWTLCETGIEPIDAGSDPLTENFIYSVTETSPGEFDILLDRPISAKHWTTITYEGDDSYVTYSSLPADSNADNTSAPGDILSFFDCCLNHVCTPPHGDYSCDTDHSGVVGPPDYLRLIDLLNGAGKFIAWNNVDIASNTCPGGGESAMAGGALPEGASYSDAGNVAYMAGLVDLLTRLDVNDLVDESGLAELVSTLSDFTVQVLTYEEQQALADALEDPDLTFASEIVAKMIPDVAIALRESD